MTDRELGYLTNEVLAEYPGATDAVLTLALRERILELDILRSREEREWDQAEECESTPVNDPDLEGPNHPCNYCYVPGILCVSCRRFEHSKGMQEVVAAGGDPLKVFGDLTAEELGPG